MKIQFLTFNQVETLYPQQYNPFNLATIKNPMLTIKVECMHHLDAHLLVLLSRSTSSTNALYTHTADRFPIRFQLGNSLILLRNENTKKRSNYDGSCIVFAFVQESVFLLYIVILMVNLRSIPNFFCWFVCLNVRFWTRMQYIWNNLWHSQLLNSSTISMVKDASKISIQQQNREKTKG